MQKNPTRTQLREAQAAQDAPAWGQKGAQPNMG
jgi:hypothetical protein